MTLLVIVRSYGVIWTDKYSLIVAISIGVFLFVAGVQRIYTDSNALSLGRRAAKVCYIWLLVVMGLLLFGYATKTSAEYSRLTLFTWFVITPILLILWHAVLLRLQSELYKRGWNVRRVAIAGARDLGKQVAYSMLNSHNMGMKPVGFYDDRKTNGPRPLVHDPLPIVGTMEDLVRAAREGDIDVVFIALPMRAEERIKMLVSKLSDTTASVYIVPDFFMFDLLSARWGNIGGLPVVSIYDTPFYGIDGWLKRSFDVVMASAILVLIALPMLFIAAAIKLTSPGPVLFKQRRYGINGEMIEVYKFRSMTVTEDGDEVRQATKGDARVTKLGAFLRRTSMDELPQFFNVLLGTMSIVGPRPHAVSHNEEYRGLINGYMLRHKVKPGITGLAQVNGWRGETDTLEKMQKRIEYDLEYINRWSVWLDAKIVLKTITHGFVGKNAY
ncbi:MAG: undecaprenyl-phosphate glucose phosphotransferase [Gammaproteobacteria bacterium]|nr:undecaprenyl-phosphate glucose phosphotransferase [Gammaproteobacteria bacterium]